MSARERLETYLDSLRARLRTHIYARARGRIAVAASAITALTVWTLQRQEFAPAIALAGRVAIGRAARVRRCSAAVASAASACGAMKVRTSSSSGFPDENGRIQTYLDGKRRESQGLATPLLSLLAADAVTIAERTPPDEIVSSRRIAAGMLVAVAALVVARGIARRRAGVLGLRQPPLVARHGVAAQCSAGAECDRDAGQRDCPSQQRPRDSRGGRRLSSARRGSVRPLRRSPGLGARADAARRRRATRASSSGSMRCAVRCSTTSMQKARAAASTASRSSICRASSVCS